ncbi:MAG: hypothetical protein ACREBQ_07460 [Nitrososphaerales archaeon]
MSFSDLILRKEGDAQGNKREIYGKARHKMEKLLAYSINKRRASYSKTDYVLHLCFVDGRYAKGIS